MNAFCLTLDKKSQREHFKLYLSMTYNKADAICLYWHPVPIQINPALHDLKNFVIFITFDP
jgi:hypothetical protein